MPSTGGIRAMAAMPDPAMNASPSLSAQVLQPTDGPHQALLSDFYAQTKFDWPAFITAS
jgi:hypothetical protein